MMCELKVYKNGLCLQIGRGRGEKSKGERKGMGEGREGRKEGV